MSDIAFARAQRLARAVLLADRILLARALRDMPRTKRREVLERARLLGLPAAQRARRAGA